MLAQTRPSDVTAEGLLPLMDECALNWAGLRWAREQRIPMHRLQFAERVAVWARHEQNWRI